MTNGRWDPTDDAVVVLEMAAGSEAALETLYDRHATAIFAAVYRLTSDRGTAEEVVQETFLTLWNRAETFDPMTGSLASWLHAIARNRAIDRLRAIGRRPSMVGLGALSAPDEDPNQALERLAARGTVVAGSAPTEDPRARSRPPRRVPRSVMPWRPCRTTNAASSCSHTRTTCRRPRSRNGSAGRLGPSRRGRDARCSVCGRSWEREFGPMPDDAVMPVSAGEDR